MVSFLQELFNDFHGGWGAPSDLAIRICDPAQNWLFFLFSKKWIREWARIPNCWAWYSLGHPTGENHKNRGPPLQPLEDLQESPLRDAPKCSLLGPLSGALYKTLALPRFFLQLQLLGAQLSVRLDVIARFSCTPNLSHIWLNSPMIVPVLLK